MDFVVTNLELKLGRRRVLQNINLQIPSGDIHVLLGAAGSGKTILVECLAGMRRIQAGAVFVHGESLSKRSVRAKMGVVFANPNFFSHLSMQRNLELNLAPAQKRIRGEEAIHSLCERLRISHLLAALPDDLSAWHKLQMQLARALLNDPAVLVLDAPFEQIPVGYHNALRVLLAEEAERGAALLLATSLPRQAQLVADKIALLEQGAIVQSNSPQAFYTRPNNIFVANVFYDQGLGIIPGVFTKRMKTMFDCVLLGEFDVRIPCRFDKLLDYDNEEFCLGVQASQVSLRQPKEPAIRIKGSLITNKRLGNSHVSLWRLSGGSLLETRTQEEPGGSKYADLWIRVNGTLLFDEHGETLAVL